MTKSRLHSTAVPPPAEIAKVYNYAREGGYDAVYTFFSEKTDSCWRNLGSCLTNRLSDYVLDKPNGLYLSSFRCISAFVARHICKYEGAFPYIDGIVLQVTGRIGQVEVEHRKRAVGSSGYTLRSLLHLWSNRFVNYSIAPLRISTVIGTFFALLGFLGAVEVVIESFLLDNPAGWESIMCGLFIFCGTQLLILGIIGEYVGRLYLNSNKRPQYVVREVIRKPYLPDQL